MAVVAEMGARGVGHIATLADVARPTIGVITNIGMAHAEFFGSRDEVARAKGELLEALPADGHAVLCADDDMTPGLRARTGAAVLTAGAAAGADVRVQRRAARRRPPPVVPPRHPLGRDRRAAPARCGAPTRPATPPWPWPWPASSACALDAAVAGLAGAVGSPLRMDLRRSPAGLVVLNDSYNANPTSMAAAVDALAGLGAGGRRFAVLGPMAELGPHSAAEHQRLGKLVAAAGVELLVAVGAPDLAEGAESGRRRRRSRSRRRTPPSPPSRPGSGPATPCWSRPAGWSASSGWPRPCSSWTELAR